MDPVLRGFDTFSERALLCRPRGGTAVALYFSSHSNLSFI